MSMPNPKSTLTITSNTICNGNDSKSLASLYLVMKTGKDKMRLQRLDCITPKNFYKEYNVCDYHYSKSYMFLSLGNW